MAWNCTDGTEDALAEVRRRPRRGRHCQQGTTPAPRRSPRRSSPRCAVGTSQVRAAEPRCARVAVSSSCNHSPGCGFVLPPPPLVTVYNQAVVQKGYQLNNKVAYPLLVPFSLAFYTNNILGPAFTVVHCPNSTTKISFMTSASTILLFVPGLGSYALPPVVSH